jgi:hypothetical protein
MDDHPDALHLFQNPPFSDETSNSWRDLFRFHLNENVSQILAGNVLSRQRNIFGPVSLIRRRRSQKPQTQIPEAEIRDANSKKPVDANGHNFAMRKIKIPSMKSLENVETDRAERAEFSRMMMLATIQDETFHP